MTFADTIKKSVLEGFNYADITTTRIAATMLITFLIALYIFYVYRLVNRKGFYDKEFNIALAIISMITAGIVLAMQSSLVISLGMVGALSIVRFRTAIKRPMDLLFLFWSVGIGIINGAGLFELSIVVSLCATIGMLLLQFIPNAKASKLMVINADRPDAEADIMAVLNANATNVRVDSRTIRKDGMDMIVAVKPKDEAGLVKAISEVAGVTTATLLYHDSASRD
ncbi:MAG: DUF4956 domain-containing protein [Pseudobutyrivibrio sp.]|nr:DUF4956 domain-containing protein [Pseudobutyrivibrio sp.]